MPLQSRLSSLITTIKGSYDSLDARVTTLEGAGGGGSSSRASFQVTDYTNALNLGNPPNAPEIILFGPTPDFADTGFSYSAGELTIGSELDGKRAMVFASIGCKSTNRTEILLQLERWTGSAWEVDIVTANYATRDSDQDDGVASISGRIITLTAGDKWRVTHAIDADSTILQAKLEDVTFWSVVEV